MHCFEYFLRHYGLTKLGPFPKYSFYMKSLYRLFRFIFLLNLYILCETNTIAGRSVAHLINYNCNVILTNQFSPGRFFHLPYLSVNNAAQRLSHAAADVSLVKIIIAHSHTVFSLTLAATYVHQLSRCI